MARPSNACQHLPKEGGPAARTRSKLTLPDDPPPSRMLVYVNLT